MPSDDGHLLQARLAHLSTIQSVIGRLAGFSATVKNFSLTIGAGLLALAYQHAAAALLPAAAGFALIFMCLDAYYLALERTYRRFYEAVSQRPLSDAMRLSLNSNRARWTDYLRALSSISVAGFYLPIMALVALLIYGGNHVVTTAH